MHPYVDKIFILVRRGCYTCTTSAECKTVIIVVLMVMSGMDPHMISGNIGIGNGHILVGLCRSGFDYVVGRSR
jgi:hypothetical protein